MITGDHPATAGAVARDLGVLDGGQLITGAELDAMQDSELDVILPGVTVVARGTPHHKVRVVQAFQRLGRVVAMTGDGETTLWPSGSPMSASPWADAARPRPAPLPISSSPTTGSRRSSVRLLRADRCGYRSGARWASCWGATWARSRLPCLAPG